MEDQETQKEKFIEIEKRLRNLDKMQTLGQFTRGMTHDFNNQIVIIRNYTELIREELEDDSMLAGFADKVLNCTAKTSEISKRFVRLAQRSAPQCKNIEVHQLINEILLYLTYGIAQNTVVTDALEAHSCTINADPNQVQNAILSIVNNALDAMPEGGSLHIATQETAIDEKEWELSPYDVKSGNFIQIDITDSGTGMSEEQVNNMFQPFYTTREGSRCGVGLAAVHETIINHDGAISVKTKPGEGTTISLFLPLSE